MRLWYVVKKSLGLRREPEHLRRGWVGEAAAQRHLKRAGLKSRFAIVEVPLLYGAVSEVRHLPNAFPLTRTKRHA